MRVIAIYSLKKDVVHLHFHSKLNRLRKGGMKEEKELLARKQEVR